ncbi:hypothetical protein GW933_00045 [Candidatus Falkowbacteria bacterium]|uniref:Uncharacterized protein n=1 Tax=Candidatus Buchananbacteria bacterium CG10_big_fil_rev_8_21_14_0_10_33_19 TaxID=1974525 RepID=A0A2H0W2Q9_9BACT|nr:hypothetical protein [Candidatus Falkowbacteria bacterium]PIS05655.1 MAG: hypothetical protein COT80_02665 [Candidatus Buchananbacteria bacterium CG10_big_fil_rev_8_21_14_0_10_33_19]
MAYKKRGGRQVSEIIPDEQGDIDQGIQDFAYDGNSGGAMKFVIVALVAVIILVGGWYLLDNYTNINLPGMSSDQNLSNGWQAIFLSNGQVYFGKVEKITDRDLVLTDIYYLQVVTKPLQQSQEAPTVEQTQSQQELTLAKLGNELHGPVDRMVINRDQILLTEQLKEDSKVVTAITAYVTEQAQK